MSTGSNRNQRGIHVRQRNSAGEPIPQPIVADGAAGVNAHLARHFATIAEGLQVLPENITEAIRQLPETYFPPPWMFWMLVDIIRRIVMERRARDFLRARCPVRCRRDHRGVWTADPTVEDGAVDCRISITGSRAFATVDDRTNDARVSIPLRFEPVNASEVIVNAWEYPMTLRVEDLSPTHAVPRHIASARLRTFTQQASWGDLVNDLAEMQLVLLDEDTEPVAVTSDYDRVVLDFYRWAVDPQWQPFIAALAGDWFLLEDLALAANDQAILAEARRRSALFIRTWLANPKHVVTEWEGFDVHVDWRASCLRMIHSRGPDYFRQQIQPYLQDLHWIADWGDALPPFCDASWRPELLEIIGRLLNTPRYGAAMTCVEHLFQDESAVEGTLQTTIQFGILVGVRWEELALLLLAIAPHLAMPSMESALTHSECHALLPFLAALDAEWSRRLLQRHLQESQQRDLARHRQVLFALSQSKDPETASPANRLLVEMTGRSGLRGRKRERFMEMMRAVHLAEQLYRNQPDEAADNLVSSIAYGLTDGSDPTWIMSAATGRRLLDRLVANRLADVAVASNDAAHTQGAQP